MLMPNRLAQSGSLYLRQHADNPVDWYPWGDEAFERAMAEGKPVFLSVGYASCHWCHVMAHETFEDASVAAILNEHFVSIKLDREERPDIDEAYMAAVQLATNRGGWPMTVFLTPERDPFFAGTYFPKEDRGQAPGFLSIIAGIAEGWKTSRMEFEEAAAEFATSLRELIAKTPPESQSGLHAGLLQGALGALHHDFDPSFAGFGGAPKFPPHTAIELCLNLATSELMSDEDRSLALFMAHSTLVSMAAGGIRDHVGGGFHRYSTDAHWGLPHFEKMLIDNALLLANYSLAARVTGFRAFQRVADEIVEWLEREMKLDGLYCSALDADTEGEEGRTYTWSWAEVKQVLGERAVPFMEAYGFALGGNFDDEATGTATGKNIPMLDIDAAGQDEMPFESELKLLLEARVRRPQPLRDDKALIGVNGLLIAGFTLAGRPELAAELASRITHFLFEDEALRVPRYIAGGGAVGDGFLEDYAGLTFGLTILAEAAPEGSWGAAARELAHAMVERFWDSSTESFFSTSDHQEKLFGRVRPIFDQPAPSATAVAVRSLVRTGLTPRAEKALVGVAGWMERVPQASEALHTAYVELLTIAGRTHGVDDGIRLWVEWQNYPLRGTLHFTIPTGWHVDRDALEITTSEFGVKPLVSGQGEGDWDIPFLIDIPGDWAGQLKLTATWQVCSERECLPRARRSWDLVVQA